MKTDFDVAAKQYDTVFTFSNIGKAQRSRVYKYVNPLLKKDHKLNILELNCGTGEDAIYFAKVNKVKHDVIATDISEGMISASKAKKYTNNLEFKVQDINALSNTSFNKKFDFIIIK